MVLYEGTEVCFLLLICGSCSPEAACYGALWWGRCSLGPQVALLGDTRAARECRFSPERSTTVILNVCLSQEGDPVWSVCHHRPVCKILLPAGSWETWASSADFLCSFSASGFSGQSLHPVLLCFCPINLDAWKLIFPKFKILLCVGESLLLIHITQINHFSLWYKYSLMNIICSFIFWHTHFIFDLWLLKNSVIKTFMCVSIHRCKAFLFLSVRICLYVYMHMCGFAYLYVSYIHTYIQRSDVNVEYLPQWSSLYL